jgi:hypothetical protein
MNLLVIFLPRCAIEDKDTEVDQQTQLSRHIPLPSSARPTYSRGDSEISVTEILSPPQLVQLRRRHAEEIEVDAADQVWSLFGSACHNILQHGKDDHHVVEERLFTTFEGWRISGQIDLQEYQSDGSVIISDYKVTSAWAVQQEKTDWIDQLNMYAWLVERVKSVPVTGLKIVGIVRDWSRREAAYKDAYPQAPIVTTGHPAVGSGHPRAVCARHGCTSTTRPTSPQSLARCLSVRRQRCGRSLRPTLSSRTAASGRRKYLPSSRRPKRSWPNRKERITLRPERAAGHDARASVRQHRSAISGKTTVRRVNYEIPHRYLGYHRSKPVLRSLHHPYLPAERPVHYMHHLL